MMNEDSSLTYINDYLDTFDYGFAFAKNERGKKLCPDAPAPPGGVHEQGHQIPRRARGRLARQILALARADQKADQRAVLDR